MTANHQDPIIVVSSAQQSLPASCERRDAQPVDHRRLDIDERQPNRSVT
jgi:hypothetical protein